MRFYIKYCLHISFILSRATLLDNYAMQKGVERPEIFNSESCSDYTDATNCYGDITVCSKLVKNGFVCVCVDTLLKMIGSGHYCNVHTFTALVKGF